MAEQTGCLVFSVYGRKLPLCTLVPRDVQFKREKKKVSKTIAAAPFDQTKSLLTQRARHLYTNRPFCLPVKISHTREKAASLDRQQGQTGNRTQIMRN